MNRSFYLLFWYILTAVYSSPLTLPLRSHLLQEPTRYHHNLHASAYQTYHLKPLRTIFTLPLNINGFEYELSIDTGSADLFIKGHGMEGKPERQYTCEECLWKNRKVTIGYLDGFLSTYTINANITLGVHNFDEYILVAYQTQSKNFRKMGGILGLSFQEVAKNKKPNFINTLINNKIVDKYVFSVKLNFRKVNESFITFGTYDPKYIAPGHSLQYYSIPSHHTQYRLKISSVMIGQGSLDINQTLLDTGNTCISIPDTYTDDILNEFNTDNNNCWFKDETGNTQFKLMECEVGSFDELPTITINIGEAADPYEITKEYYLDKCTANYFGTYKCGTLLQTVNNRTQIFLGDTFFLRYYGVFNLVDRKIGLAQNDDITTLQDVLSRT